MPFPGGRQLLSPELYYEGSFRTVPYLSSGAVPKGPVCEFPSCLKLPGGLFSHTTPHSTFGSLLRMQSEFFLLAYLTSGFSSM